MGPLEPIEPSETTESSRGWKLVSSLLEGSVGTLQLLAAYPGAAHSWSLWFQVL